MGIPKMILEMHTSAVLEGDCLNLEEYESNPVFFVLKAITVSVLDEDGVGLPRDMATRLGLVLLKQEQGSDTRIPLSDSQDDVPVLELLQKLGAQEVLRRLKAKAESSQRMSG